MANPGANFTYLWGAAWSCETFEPVLGRGLDHLASQETLPAAFRPCLRAGAPMAAPDPCAVFRFYSQTRSFEDEAAS